MSKNTQRMQFATDIQAPVAVVWQQVTAPQSYRQWTTAFCEGSNFEGSWDQGAAIRFLSPSGDGMVSEIAENRAHEFISIRHLGYIHQGVDDTTSAAITAWAPAYENYSFSALPNGGTRLVIDQDVALEYENYMTDAWPKALALLKQLCEAAPRV
jgi:hypothetical protein